MDGLMCVSANKNTLREPLAAAAANNNECCHQRVAHVIFRSYWRSTFCNTKRPSPGYIEIIKASLTREQHLLLRLLKLIGVASKNKKKGHGNVCMYLLYRLDEM
jgi:transcriptional regulator CtsR